MDEDAGANGTFTIEFVQNRDLDGDGRDNAEEFRLGSDPFTAD
jgi:hypothetical protein